MPGATSGPFVDQISLHWSELGRNDGMPIGLIKGFNYGIKVVIYESNAKLLKETADNRPGDLKALDEEIDKVIKLLSKPLPEPPYRRKDFPILYVPDPDKPGPSLEQIWYDIDRKSVV